MALWLGAPAALAKDQGSVLAPNGNSQLSIIPITENLILFSGLCRSQACIQCTSLYAYLQAK